MERKIETSEVESFYDALASDYDAMTDFRGRFAREEPVFRELVRRFGVRTALDAGCGTGFHSFILARMGVHVTAVDISAEMIAKVEQHAGELDLRVTAARVRFQELRNTVSREFDLVMSLGNSLTHLLSDEDLLAALSNLRDCVRPGGVLLLQLLNYERILRFKERVQNVRDVGAVTYVRYYEFAGGNIHFHIQSMNKEGKMETHRVAVLRPLLPDDLIAALRSLGFSQISPFGGLSLVRFDSEESKDLVVVAYRET